MATRMGDLKITIRDGRGLETGQPTNGADNRIYHPRGKVGENVAKYNFKSIAKLGLLIRQSRMANEIIGSYTNNKLGQRRFKTGMLMGQYAIGIAKFGVFGLAYATGDMGYRVAMHEIDIQKKNREARHMREISGISIKSMSRYNGEML